jgi:hypothetical protein
LACIVFTALHEYPVKQITVARFFDSLPALSELHGHLTEVQFSVATQQRCKKIANGLITSVTFVYPNGTTPAANSQVRPATVTLLTF